MKKIYIFIIPILAFYGCESTNNTSSIQTPAQKFDSDLKDYCKQRFVSIRGMRYMFLFNGHFMSVTNLTKDSLEVALLKKQLNGQ